MNKKNPLLKVVTPSKELRKKGREALSGKWFKSMLLLIVWGIFAGVLSAGAGFVSSMLSATAGADAVYSGSSMTTGTGIVAIIIVLLVEILAFVLASAFTMGVSTYFLKIAKNKEAGIGDLFAAFREGAVFRSAGLAFVQGLFIILWSILFVIPGIIAAFRYSQAFYVLAETPHKSVSECMNKSKELMSVNKSKLFWLNLSFIGWWILSSLVATVIMTVIFLVMARDSIALLVPIAGGQIAPETMAYIGPQIISMILAVLAGGIIAGIVYLPVQVYSATASAVFYRTVQYKRAQAVRTAAETELLLAVEDEKFLQETDETQGDELDPGEDLDEI